MLLQVKMEEEEIDSWYEEEKQKCMDEYLKNIETVIPEKIKDNQGSKNSKDFLKNHEESEKVYNDKLNKLIDKYNRLMSESIQNKKNGKMKRVISRIKNMFFIIMVLLLINSCAGIDQNQAEAKAAQFVNQNVRFFAREENSTLNLPQYRIDSITSFQEKSDWLVAIHVSAKIGNETKKNELAVKLNRQGDVLEFNGKKVLK